MATAKIQYDRELWLRPPAGVVGPGNKFNPDGSARRYRGNTIISFLPEGCPLARRATRTLIDKSGVAAWSLLPPSSYHMTVFQLFCEDRRPEQWSSRLAPDCPLEQADRFAARAVGAIDPPAGIVMRYRGIKALGGLEIQLEPATLEIARKLASYRDRVAAATGIRLADHDCYVFHVGLGYRVAALTAVEADKAEAVLQQADDQMKTEVIFSIDSPVLTFFDDMLAFNRSRVGRQTPAGTV